MREALTLSVGDVAVHVLLQIHAVLGVAGIGSYQHHGGRGHGGPGVGDADVEDRGVGDAEVEDGVTRLPRCRGPQGDARTLVLKKRRALGLRKAAREGGSALST